MDQYPMEFEGETVRQGRLSIRGTIEFPRPLHRGDDVIVIGFGRVEGVGHEPYDGKLTRKHTVPAEEVLVLPSDEADEVLLEAIESVRERQREAQAEVERARKLAEEQEQGIERLPGVDDEGRPVEASGGGPESIGSVLERTLTVVEEVAEDDDRRDVIEGELDAYSKSELLEEAREAGVKGRSKLTKAELVSELADRVLEREAGGDA